MHDVFVYGNVKKNLPFFWVYDEIGLNDYKLVSSDYYS